MICHATLAALLLASGLVAAESEGAGNLLSATRVVADSEAKELVSELLSLVPARNFTHYGSLNLRLPDRRRVSVPVRHAVELIDGEKWRDVYETQPADSISAERLIVIHHPDGNEYWHAKAEGKGKPGQPERIPVEKAAAMVFAESDYGLADLGLEFLRWPGQRLVRDAKITMRLTRPCKVLESTHPNPGPDTYSRVVSWIDSETGALLFAESYDAQNKKAKVFSLKGFQKVNDQWQPKEFKIETPRQNSVSSFEFKFDEP